MKLDLHIHTNCSDGTDDWKTILQEAEKLKLEVISITDHNNVDVYFQMQNPEKYYSGKIISGIEPECFYMGRCIELIGYGIDVEKMHKSLKGIYKSRDEINKFHAETCYKSLVNNGIKLTPNIIDSWDKNLHYYAIGHLHKDMKRYPENKKIISDDESWNKAVQCYRNYIGNPSSPFYVDESDFYPTADTIYKLIKLAGGLVFIAHPFTYGKDSITILESLVSEFQIDGIECFYNTFTPEQTEFLLDFCKKHNLLVSAGSDYHGSSRPHVKLGVEDRRFRELLKWIKK